MTPDNFSTHSLIPRDQFEAWREWFEPVLDVFPKHATGDEFTAEMPMWKLGGLAIEPNHRAARQCRPSEEQPQARSGRSLGD